MSGVPVTRPHQPARLTRVPRACLSAHLRPRSAAAVLGSMRLHDMRHTCVSLLLDLGVPPHIVREIVGHSDIEVTMTIYAHAALDEKRAALRKLGDALG